MNYNKKTVRDFDPHGKKVLLRCDFNVPQNKETGEITSDKRIVAALPTIKYLLENGAAVIACSHLGKPKGEWKESLSLAPVAKRLSELLGMDVIFAKDIIGEDAKAKAAALQPGQLLLLENLRFDKREEKNDPEFAKELSSMAEVYVSDAFGTVHRAHASTEGVSHYLPSVAGFLVEKELNFMGKALEEPKRPLVAILGGSKVSDKIGVINNLLQKADTILIGGDEPATFNTEGEDMLGEALPPRSYHRNLEELDELLGGVLFPCAGAFHVHPFDACGLVSVRHGITGAPFKRVHWWGETGKRKAHPCQSKIIHVRPLPWWTVIRSCIVRSTRCRPR